MASGRDVTMTWTTRGWSLATTTVDSCSLTSSTARAPLGVDTIRTVSVLQSVATSPTMACLVPVARGRLIMAAAWLVAVASSMPTAR